MRGSSRLCENYSPGLGTVPVVFGCTLFITIVITYILAVHYGHVYPYFPAISDTGTQKPESNVFSMFLAICSAMGVMMIILRYLQVRFTLHIFDEDRPTLTALNVIGALLGFAVAIGMAIVAAYQVSLLFLNFLFLSFFVTNDEIIRFYLN